MHTVNVTNKLWQRKVAAYLHGYTGRIAPYESHVAGGLGETCTGDTVGRTRGSSRSHPIHCSAASMVVEVELVMMQIMPSASHTGRMRSVRSVTPRGASQNADVSVIA